MEIALRLVISYAVAFMLGAIPWGYIIGKRFYGADIRECGSGNVGATNVMRTLGWRAGLAVAMLDVAKGAQQSSSPPSCSRRA